jgi:hypothetical protein
MGYGVAESIMRRAYGDDEDTRIQGLCLSLRLVSATLENWSVPALEK